MVAYRTPQYPQWQGGYEIDHVNAAREHLRAIFPEAHLAPSSVEMTVIEALASIIGPIAMSYQMAPAAVVEHLMGLYHVRRYTGQRAIGKARFTISGGASRVRIVPGTRLRYTVGDNAGALDFRVTEDLTIIGSESTVGEAWIEATENGTAYNGVPAGATLDMVDYMLAVESVTLSERTRAGEDFESDESFQRRAMAVLARQTSALVYAEQFGAAAISREEVGRAFPVDRWNAQTGATALGHISLAVTDTDGMALPPEDKQAIHAELSAQILASLVLHVIDPEYTTVNLDITVEATPGANHAAVEGAVRTELQSRLDPLTWNWWDTITVYDLVSWVDDVPDVARVVTAAGVAVYDDGSSVVNGDGSIPLRGPAPLPLPGTFTITVNNTTR